MRSALDGLNTAQREAVTHGTGPLLILAGAGSGKTRVITRRVAWLVDGGVDPTAILCVTFTNRAAGELKERLAADLGVTVARAVTAGTFHAFGLRLLKEHAGVAGLPQAFTVLDGGDQVGLVRRLLRERGAGRSVEPRDVLQEISRAKRGLVKPEAFRPPDTEPGAWAGGVYAAYEEALRAMGGVDFDDLVGRPVELLTARPDVRRRLCDRYLWLLVDEFQDTSTTQLRLVSEVAGEGGNLTAVGDDDQSIYGWRGADNRNVLEFEAFFPGAKVMTLERNYRSTGAILAAANAVIEDAPGRRSKRLWTDEGEGRPVALVPCRDDVDEAAFVADDIVASSVLGRRLGEFAVLYRTNGQSGPFEEALRGRRIPHRVVGGTRLFDRKEVRDVLAYWRLLVNTHDDLSLRRVLNWPGRGIGPATVETLAAWAGSRGRSIWSALIAVARGDLPLPAPVRSAAEALTTCVLAARERAKDDAVGAVRHLHAGLGLSEAIRKDATGAGDVVIRLRRVEEMIDSLARHLRPDASDATWVFGEVRDLGTFLERVTLDDRPDDAERGDGGPDDRVVLSTLHAAKGLEFPVVYLVGLEEGMMPFRREGVVRDVEEERRLLYVGITRARERLVLSRRRLRTVRGERRPCQPSRFLSALAALTVDEPPPGGPGAYDPNAAGPSVSERLMAALAALPPGPAV